MTERIAAIDAMVTLGITPSAAAVPVLARFGGSGSSTVRRLVEDMDRNDVQISVIGTVPVNFERYRPGPYSVGTGVTDEQFDEACRSLALAVASYPDRLRAFVYLDPSEPQTAVRRVRRAVRDYGIRVAHVIPSVVGLPPNHPAYFALYGACVDLGVPLRINIGMPGPSHRAELQRPMLLDEVLLTFPELTLIGAHLGHPWLDEVIALLRKHPQFHLMTSGWAPCRVPDVIWAEARRAGSRIMWASDHPLLTISRCRTEADGLGLGVTQIERYLRSSAVEAHQLEL